MELVALPRVAKRRILIGTTVRKPPEVLQWYLKSLAALQIPDDVEVGYWFGVDMPRDHPSREVLRDFAADRPVMLDLVGDSSGSEKDYDDQNTQTHHWQGSAMERVARTKNEMIAYALRCRYDYVFFVDADLILEPTTLKSLLSMEAPVACAVYWTRWVNDPRIHAAPQVWLFHPYVLEGRGYENEGEFRAKLLSRNPVQVWGQGACSLIRRDVLEKGVDFSRVPELPTEGMWQGEDRHFCVKCERMHVPMMADPWPDIFHIYHPNQIPDAEKWYQALVERPRLTKASLGDLVSLRLEALETQMNTMGGPLPIAKLVRGRLGTLKLLPEIEEAVTQMEVGDTKVFPVHPGADYPLPQYRGQRRLMRVTLIDAKPFYPPPVVEDEIYPIGHVMLDGTTLTPEQHAGVRENG